MAFSRSTPDRGDKAGARAPSPHGLAAIVMALAGAPILLILALTPAAHVVQVVSLAMLAAAAAAAAYAWWTGAARGTGSITLWDIAGGLAFLGCAAGLLSEPAQVAHLFGIALLAP
jgi:predicted benzoate:H+ symporter BenE